MPKSKPSKKGHSNAHSPVIVVSPPPAPASPPPPSPPAVPAITLAKVGPSAGSALSAVLHSSPSSMPMPTVSIQSPRPCDVTLYKASQRVSSGRGNPPHVNGSGEGKALMPSNMAGGGNKKGTKGTSPAGSPSITNHSSNSATPLSSRPVYVPLPPLPTDALALSQSNMSFTLLQESAGGRGTVMTAGKGAAAKGKGSPPQQGGKGMGPSGARNALLSSTSHSFAESLIESESMSNSEATSQAGGDDTDDDTCLMDEDYEEDYCGDSLSPTAGRDEADRRRLLNGGITPRYHRSGIDSDGPTPRGALGGGGGGGSYLPSRPKLLSKKRKALKRSSKECDAIIILSGGGVPAAAAAGGSKLGADGQAKGSGSPSSSVCMRRAEQLAGMLHKFRLHKGAVLLTTMQTAEEDVEGEEQKGKHNAGSAGKASTKKDPTKKDPPKKKKKKGTAGLPPNNTNSTAVPSGVLLDASDVPVFEARICDEGGHEVVLGGPQSSSSYSSSSSSSSSLLTHAVIRVTLLQPTLFYREQIRLHNNVAPLAPDLPFPEAVEDLKSSHKAALLAEFLHMLVDRGVALAAQRREREWREAQHTSNSHHKHGQGVSASSSSSSLASSILSPLSNSAVVTAEVIAKGLDKLRMREGHSHRGGGGAHHNNNQGAAAAVVFVDAEEQPDIVVCTTHDDILRQRVWALGRQWAHVLGRDARTRSSLMHIAERPLFEYFGADTMHYFAYMNYFHGWLLFSAIVAILMNVINYAFFTEADGEGIFGDHTVQLNASEESSPLDPFHNNNHQSDSHANNNPIIPFFSIITMFSSVLFVKLWERKVASLSVDFSLNSDETSRAPVRRGFYGEVRNSPITGEKELYYPEWKRNAKQVVSWTLAVIFLVGGLFVQLCSINLQGYMNTMSQPLLEIDFFDDFSDEGAIFDSNGPYAMIPVVLHVLVVMLLNMLFKVLSELLTDWENYRTDAEAITSLTQKRLSFEFVNNFCFLFYIAFYRFDLPMLTAELQSLFWMDQLRRLAMETVVPYLQVYSAVIMLAVWRAVKSAGWAVYAAVGRPILKGVRRIAAGRSGGIASVTHHQNSTRGGRNGGGSIVAQKKALIKSQRQPPGGGAGPDKGKDLDGAAAIASVQQSSPRSSSGGSTTGSEPGARRRRQSSSSASPSQQHGPAAATTATAKKKTAYHCDSNLQEADNFDDYLEMTMQFGYVTLFASAFPLASLFALICGLIEVRSDLFRKCFIQRRAVERTSQHTIHLWTQVLKIFAFLSVITNTLLFSFTTGHLLQLVVWWRGGTIGLGGLDIDAAGLNTSEGAVWNASMAAAVEASSITPEDAQHTVSVAFMAEHVFLLIAFFLFWRIPSVPREVEEEKLRRRYNRVKAKVRQIHGQLGNHASGRK